MTTDIRMPKLQADMDRGKLVQWFVKEGEDVQEGDLLAEVDTGRALIELESEQDGTITALLVAPGSAAVNVDDVIATLSPRTIEAGATVAGSPDVVDTPIADTDKTVRAVTDTTSPETTPTRPASVREALNAALREEMRADGDVFLIGEDIGAQHGTYKITQDLLDEFGSRRVMDMPVCETGFAGMGIGAAFAGLKPVVEFMNWSFALGAVGQIINSAAKTCYMSGGTLNCPIVFRGPHGPAPRVGAQHSHDFSAFYAHIPGLKVVIPYTAADAKGLLKSAIRDPNPVIFLEHEVLYGEKSEVPVSKDFTVPLGKARIAQTGSDLTIISYGLGMRSASEAANQLRDQGVSVELIDLRTVRPIDYETVLESVKKTTRCITVEQSGPVGSIGNHLAAYLMREAFHSLSAPVLNVTAPDIPMPYAENLEQLALVSAQEVIRAAQETLGR